MDGFNCQSVLVVKENTEADPLQSLKGENGSLMGRYRLPEIINIIGPASG